MRKCETCRWWTKDTKYDHDENWGTCGRSEKEGAPMSSGSYEDFWTIADRFGCTEHEPREADA